MKWIELVIHNRHRDLILRSDSIQVTSYVPAMAICTLIWPSCRKEHISFNNSFLVLCQLLLFKMMHSIPWLVISFVLKFCQYFIFIYEKGVVLYCCIPFCVHTLDLWSYLQNLFPYTTHMSQQWPYDTTLSSCIFIWLQSK